MTGKLISVQVFTSSGTYVPSPGTKAIVIDNESKDEVVIFEYDDSCQSRFMNFIGSGGGGGGSSPVASRIGLPEHFSGLASSVGSPGIDPRSAYESSAIQAPDAGCSAPSIRPPSPTTAKQDGLSPRYVKPVAAGLGMLAPLPRASAQGLLSVGLCAPSVESDCPTGKRD